MTKIYNLDMVDRIKLAIEFEQIQYVISEPTVLEYVKIEQLKLETLEGQCELVKMLAPKLHEKLGVMSLEQRRLVIQATFKVVSGNIEGKKQLEELVKM